MWDAAAIVFLLAAIAVWIDSLRARELAVRAGRSACERYSLQFLDDTVSFARLRLGRNGEGELRLARTYTFEFSDTGNNRRYGSVIVLGSEIEDLSLEPYPVNEPVQ